MVRAQGGDVAQPRGHDGAQVHVHAVRARLVDVHFFRFALDFGVVGDAAALLLGSEPFYELALTLIDSLLMFVADRGTRPNPRRAARPVETITLLQCSAINGDGK